MSRRLLLGLSVLTLFFLFAATSADCIQTIEFESGVDTAYLPYRSVEFLTFKPNTAGAFPPNRNIYIIRPAIRGRQEGLLFLSSNPGTNIDSAPRFSPREFPSYEVGDEDPIRYIINAWKPLTNPANDRLHIVGVCHNEDSLFAFNLDTDKDSVRYNLLVAFDSSSTKSAVPRAQVLYTGDYDLDSNTDIIFWLAGRNRLRRLISVDFATLEIKWEREVSNGIDPSNFHVVESEQNPKFIFVSGNSANGMQDEYYDDRFASFSILNGSGEVTHLRIVGKYAYTPPRIVRNPDSNTLTVSHALPFTSPSQFDPEQESDHYYISTVDYEGNIIAQTPCAGIPTALWLMRIGESDSLRLVVNKLTRYLTVRDFDLTVRVDSVPYGNLSLNYQRRIRIPEEADSVYVMMDGLYDRSFEKLIHFPFPSSRFHIAAYDTLGNVVTYVLDHGKDVYIGYIEKKNAWDLVSVFYHRNQAYILMALSSLLVGLIVVNYYRRDTKKNLQLISAQKRELEKTHQALRKAQATIVEQEKFRQAKDIAGGFAHEIRNSLFPAQSALAKMHDASPDRIADPGWILKMTDFADKSIMRAIELTHLVSKYARIESDVKSDPVNMDAVIKQVLHDNQLKLSNMKITTRIDGSAECSVVGSQEQMYTVVNNLVLNAMDALTDTQSPTITITCTQTAETLEMAVADNGSGISKEHVDRIYDVFFSTKPSTGSGLGLSLVKKILELYDNRISIQSSVGKGTTVSLELNLADKPNQGYA